MKLPAPLLPLFLVCTPAALPAQAAENAQASVVPVALASPVDGTVEQLLAAGRELLLDERPEEALVWFEQAAEADSHSFRTRLWVLRAWMDLGRSNDTLDAIDELSRSGETGPELDYLYGMAFARRAQGHIAAGVTDSSVQMNFIDAVDQLQSAVNAAPQRFSDAYLALAESAWYVQDLEVARDAAEQAVRYHPEQGRAWLQLGKVAMSQFRTAQGVEAWGDQAGAHWSRAHAAFERAVEVLGRPVDRPARQARLADAALQLGHARVWKQRVPQAADAYAVAIGWSPATQDYSTLYNLLQPPQPATSAAGAPGPSAPSRPNSGAPSEAAPEPLPAATYFHRALEEGTRRFQETFGPDDPRDAGLLWWLGWARGAMGRPADAEQAYLASLAKEPAYVNAWFQVALARFAQGEYEGAADALLTGWDADPSVIVAEMQRDVVGNVWRVETLIGKGLARGEQLECATLAEICAETVLDEPRHWNNLGLFLRDEADQRRFAHAQGSGPEPDAAELDELYERAFAAYERALALDPENAQLLNDTALMLHYYLERDYDRAFEMYALAEAGARAVLDAGGLDEEQLAFWETVHRDAVENAQKLRDKLAGDTAPAQQ